MAKSYLYALVSVPRLGLAERARLRAVGIRPTFTRDEDAPMREPGEISLRFDATTTARARAKLAWALGPRARVVSSMARMRSSSVEGVTPAS